MMHIVGPVCHALVATFMLNSKALVTKDLQFIDYCPAYPPAVCLEKFTSKQGPGGDITTYVWCVDDKKNPVYEGDVAPMVGT